MGIFKNIGTLKKCEKHNAIGAFFISLSITHLTYQCFCSDVRPPELSCPPSQSTASNDPGTNVSTTSWDFSFTDNSLGASFPGITKNDSFTVTLTINEENVNTDLPKLLAIGKNTMTYNVTDAAGNRDSCTFIITVLGKLTCKIPKEIVRLHISMLKTEYQEISAIFALHYITLHYASKYPQGLTGILENASHHCT